MMLHGMGIRDPDIPQNNPRTFSHFSGQFPGNKALSSLRYNVLVLQSAVLLLYCFLRKRRMC